MNEIRLQHIRNGGMVQNSNVQGIHAQATQRLSNQGQMAVSKMGVKGQLASGLIKGVFGAITGASEHSYRMKEIQKTNEMQIKLLKQKYEQQTKYAFKMADKNHQLEQQMNASSYNNATKAERAYDLFKESRFKAEGLSPVMAYGSPVGNRVVQHTAGMSSIRSRVGNHVFQPFSGTYAQRLTGTGDVIGVNIA